MDEKKYHLDNYIRAYETAKNASTVARSHFDEIGRIRCEEIHRKSLGKWFKCNKKKCNMMCVATRYYTYNSCPSSIYFNVLLIKDVKGMLASKQELTTGEKGLLKKIAKYQIESDDLLGRWSPGVYEKIFGLVCELRRMKHELNVYYYKTWDFNFGELINGDIFDTQLTLDGQPLT